MSRQYRQVALIIAISFFAALVILLPFSPRATSVPRRDSGVFLYIGERILDGEIPYQNVWDHKPPFIFYLNALGLSLTPESRWGVWFIEAISLSVAIAFGLVMIRRVFGILPAIFASALWVMTLQFVIQGGNLTTEYTLPMQFAALFLATRITTGKASLLRWFIVGLLGGIAFFTKQTAIGIWIAIFLTITIDRIYRKQLGVYIQEITAIGAGALLVAAFWIAWFSAAGALEDFWDAAFRYNLVYSLSKSTLTQRISNLFNEQAPLATLGLWPLAIIGYVTAAILVLWHYRRIQKWLPLLIIVLFNFPVELALINISGAGYAHYYMTLLPSLAIFAALTFYMIISSLPQFGVSRMKLRVLTVGVLLLLSAPTLITNGSGLLRFLRGAPSDPLAEQIREITTPADSVLLWGAETAINFASQHKSPSRFVYQYPLYTENYVTEPLILEFLDDVLAGCPALIIDTRNPGTPWLEFPINSPEIARRISQIRLSYRESGMIGPWVVYSRVQEPCAQSN